MRHSLTKKRLGITFEGEILEWVDKKIRDRTFHNYQHAVEYCIVQTMKIMDVEAKIIKVEKD